MSSPNALQQPLHSFLCLVPVQSASYPPQPAAPRGVSSTNATGLPPDTTGVPTPLRDSMILAAGDVDRTVKTRRSSSVSSDGVSPRKFLKLGPVFGGGEPGVGDYADDE
ncbi:MAG: hypothetical protein M1813_006941 [Trichoglossum hirsutum]|nr:MAG: hypothetical protein M1813_006941 [Trichoglossum hirsutum]